MDTDKIEAGDWVEACGDWYQVTHFLDDEPHEGILRLPREKITAHRPKRGPFTYGDILENSVTGNIGQYSAGGQPDKTHLLHKPVEAIQAEQQEPKECGQCGGNGYMEDNVTACLIEDTEEREGTMIRLEEIQKRVEAATEGPWRNDGWDCFSPDEFEPVCVVEFPKDTVAVFVNAEASDWEEAHKTNANEDAEFIAHAREDIPYLLSLVERVAEMAADGWGETTENIMKAAMEELEAGDA